MDPLIARLGLAFAIAGPIQFRLLSTAAALTTMGAGYCTVTLMPSI